MTKEKQGVIYMLTNPSFKEYIKIGYADNLERRLNQLNRSETIPFAFRVYAVYEVTSRLTDLEVHRLIDSLNPELRTVETFDGKERVREFYAMKPEEAYNIFECIAKISGTEDRLKLMKPEGHEVLDIEVAQEVENNSKLPPFKFSYCGIKPGEVITFVKDESKTAIVVDDRKVEYGKQTMSLTALAKLLMNTDRQLQGPMYFTYNGVLLTDLRKN